MGGMRAYRSDRSRRRHLPALLLASLWWLTIAPSPAAPHPDWDPVVPGVEYQAFSLEGPNRVFVARMDRHNPALTLDSAIASGSLLDGKETVSQMAARYDQAINGWGSVWGKRNRVLAAINGSFFELETGVPWSGVVHSEWYAKWYGSLSGSTGFAWTNERVAFIGRCIHHRPERQVVTFLASGETILIDGVNTDRGRNQLIIYTSDYSPNTPAHESGVEVVVQMTRPMGILPLPAMARGLIRELRVDRGPAEMQFDTVVLSASGKKAEELQRLARFSSEVGISLEVTDLGEDCRSGGGIDWTKTYAGVGGSYVFLQDGDVVDIEKDGAVVQNPRTAICFNDDWIFFVVVDGRAPEYSLGMDMTQLGRFCKRRLEATWGINQDGGGSSALWVDGEIKNRPSDGSERAVANGMLMVLIEPKVSSRTFARGQQVMVAQDSHVYLGPGSNYPWRSVLRPMTLGVVQDSLGDLDGVLAKGSFWWSVRFGKTDGWVPEGALQPYDGRPLPPPEVVPASPGP
jgi:hypothetical protein